MSRIPICCLFFVMFALAGCQRPATSVVAVASQPAHKSGSSTAGEGTPGKDVCLLLDRSQVIAIFGPLREEATPDTGLRHERECRWRNENGQWLKISVYSADRWELEKGIVSENHPEALTGLSDEAFAVKQGTDSVVFVRSGESIVEVSCSCGMQKAKALAAMAAANFLTRTKA